MKKIKRMFIVFASVTTVSVNAANPASTDYVNKKIQTLETQIANLPLGTTYTAGTGINITGNVISATGGSSPHFIGEYYQGGIVYWIDPVDNTHGLIADLNDAPLSSTTGYAWDTSGTTLVTGATGSAAYAGIANTAAILATVVPSSNAEAATVCASSTNQGFSDWYLPSLMELVSMVDAQMIITRAAEAHGGTGLANPAVDELSAYWSSTESLFESVLSAGVVDVSSGGTFFVLNNVTRVRCIRAF